MASTFKSIGIDPNGETHLGPDGTRLEQNAQARL